MKGRLLVTEDWIGQAAQAAMAAIEAVLTSSPRCRIGLAGGQTPAPVYQAIAQRLAPAQAGRLWITLIDDRHPEASNAAMVERCWTNRATPARFLGLVTQADPQADAARVRCALATDWGGALDFVLLGTGADGHIASIFPGRPPIEGLCGVVTDSPKPPPTRISLSAGLIQRAPHRILVATGRTKGPALAAGWRLDPAVPLGALCPAPHWTWILDPAAARAAQLEADRDPS